MSSASSDTLRARGWSIHTDDSQSSSQAINNHEKNSAFTVHDDDDDSDNDLFADAEEGREIASRNRSAYQSRNLSAKQQHVLSHKKEDPSKNVAKEMKCDAIESQFSDASDDNHLNQHPHNHAHSTQHTINFAGRSSLSLKRQRSNGSHVFDENSDDILIQVELSKGGSNDSSVTSHKQHASPSSDASMPLTLTTVKVGGDDSKEKEKDSTFRLSKWAARLLDPNRPKVVAEPHFTIPLNDEFLHDFGKRVQHDNQALGLNEHVETAIADENRDEPNNQPNTKKAKIPKTSSLADHVIKIFNIKFTMTKEQLLESCQRFGDVVKIHLPMDENDSKLNTGRAIVTFASAESANACAEKMEIVEGRLLRVFLANSDGTGRSSRSNLNSARYWTQDMRTKDCRSEPTSKPCVLCAQTTHEFRDCPMKVSCFHCGMPGHVNRDCPLMGTPVPRVVCTICLCTGHHTSQCRNVVCSHQLNYSLCMVCHGKGHYSCKESKWFFGLETLTCWNCGRVGHAGFACDRPTFDVSSRSISVAMQEIENATAYSTAEEFLAELQQKKQRQSYQSPPSNHRNSREVSYNRHNVSSIRDDNRRAKS